VQLPADTDFSDTSLDQKADTYEIWHNTALINNILTVLLERESLNEQEALVLKQFIADIPQFTDMYLSKVMKQIFIYCIRQKTSTEYDYQTITFMWSENLFCITNTVNHNSMTHVLSSETKGTLIKLIKAHKPNWA